MVFIELCTVASLIQKASNEKYTDTEENQIEETPNTSHISISIR